MSTRNENFSLKIFPLLYILGFYLENCISDGSSAIIVFMVKQIFILYTNQCMRVKEKVSEY